MIYLQPTLPVKNITIKLRNCFNKASTKAATLLLLLMLFTSLGLYAQQPLCGISETFDNNDDFGLWTVSGSGNASWEWTANGTGYVSGDFWGNRSPIESVSGGGAAVLQSDSLILNQLVDSIHYDTLTSPYFSIDNFSSTSDSTVYLQYNQYYRNYQSSTKTEIEIRNEADNEVLINWTEMADNNSILQNIETTANDIQYINLTSLLSDFPNIEIFSIRVRFIFEGAYYFWIIDDVQAICGSNPFPTTSPPALGDHLFEQNYSYRIDSSGGAYHPNQLVVRFGGTTTQVGKDSLRQLIGVSSYKVCACNKSLELWELSPLQSDKDSLTSEKETSILNERIIGAKSKTKLNGGDADFNYYNFSLLEKIPPSPVGPLDSIPEGISPSPADATVVAVLDSGIDLSHDSLKPYIWANNGSASCHPNTFVGWNFPDNNNNPSSTNAHGTVVSLIIAETFSKSSCNSIRILPIKTHNEDGVGTLFDVTCGTYLAQAEGAQVVNASWGWYGAPNEVLKEAIQYFKTKNNGLFITSAGNDTINISNQPHFPAVFNQDNIIPVGSIATSGNSTEISHFSNYSQEVVLLGAPGEDLVIFASSFSGEGTSFSVPVVSGMAGSIYCDGITSYSDVRSQLLNCARAEPNLTGHIKDGKWVVGILVCPDEGLPWSPWIIVLCILIILLLLWLLKFLLKK